MELSEDNLAIIDDEERSLNTARICEEPHLFVGYVPDNRDLLRDLVLSPQLFDALDKVVGALMRTNPSSIDEDLDAFAVRNRLLVDHAQLFDSKVLEDRH